jgi:hypothetical protein
MSEGEALLHDREFVNGKSVDIDVESEFPDAVKLDHSPDEDKIVSEKVKNTRNSQNEDYLDEYRREKDETPEEQTSRIAQEKAQKKYKATVARKKGDTRRYGDKVDRSWYDYDHK